MKKPILNLALVALAFVFLSCQQTSKMGDSSREQDIPARQISLTGDTLQKVVKTDAEWREQLNDHEYYVLRQKGTERSFTGDLWNNKEKGTYVCAGCTLPLFSSDTKFRSGTGWPSFWEPIQNGHVAEKADKSHGMVRVEVVCGRCDGHLGHVFEDGPRPTGLRYCINSVSMDFVKEEEKKP
ncbi:MAG: peptide-methionine (R)-S-oxide reductase MsrB [Bacteroidota bacterium]